MLLLIFEYGILCDRDLTEWKRMSQKFAMFSKSFSTNLFGKYLSKGEIKNKLNWNQRDEQCD